MMPVLRRLLAAAEWLSLAGGYIASCALLIMAIGVALDVLARFLLGAGTKAAIEMSGYLLVAMVFLGLAYTQQTKGHIEIDFVTSRLSPRTRQRLRAFNLVVFFLYTMILGYFGWRTFWDSYVFQTTSRTGLDVLVWPYQLLIPIGLALASLLLVCQILTAIAQVFRDRSTGETS
jgi:C4-dicarboxylate transporter DctQ subunit